MLVLPFFANAQDSTLLPADYQPYYQIHELSDSALEAIKLKYPDRWRNDSTWFALQNKLFFDSITNDTFIKRLLPMPDFSDTSLIRMDKTAPLPGRPLPGHVPTWLYIAALLAVSLVALMKFLNVRQFGTLFKAFFSPRYCDEALREYESPVNMYNLSATLMCMLIYSVFLWYWAVKPGWVQVHSNMFVSFMLVFMALALFYLLRYLFIMLGAAALDAEYTYAVLVQVTVSGNMWVGLIVLPVLTMLNAAFFQFSTPMLPAFVSAGLLIFLIAKQVRVFIQVVKTFPHSIFYLILYLCALEIAPYLVIFKLLLPKTG